MFYGEELSNKLIVGSIEPCHMSRDILKKGIIALKTLLIFFHLVISVKGFPWYKYVLLHYTKEFDCNISMSVVGLPDGSLVLPF
jgi:hypothetical protein